MPQLSLYIDEDTLQKIELRAKMQKTSISKYVTGMMKEHFSKGWPDGFESVFGSVTDESFTKPEQTDFSLDTERESL